MIITIFGATGMVGKQLVKTALHKGHTVKAFGRNVYTSALGENENLKLIQGAVFDEGQVGKAIAGSDAVLSALGGAPDGTDKTRSLGMKNIVAQMEKVGVKRIVAVGGKGVLDDENGQLFIESPSYPREFIPVGTEHFKALEVLKQSSLNWTLAAPPDIIDAGPTGQYVMAATTMPSPNKNKINAGDLALFMVNELENNAFLQQKVGISN